MISEKINNESIRKSYNFITIRYQNFTHSLVTGYKEEKISRHFIYCRFIVNLKTTSK
jgi:hypothetical protein